MDFATTIIVVVFMAITVLPFVIAYFKGTVNNAKTLKSLTDFAQQHECTINEFELCGDFALGVDTKKRILFFIKKKKIETISLLVDLSLVQSCEAKKQRRDVIVDHESMSILERIELYFSPKENSQALSLDLFDDRYNDRLRGELQFVETWSKRISDYIRLKR